MPASPQSNVPGRATSSDAPVPSSSYSSILFPRALNIRTVGEAKHPCQTGSFSHTRLGREIIGKRSGARFMPRIYDFSVDHDNVLYDRASSARNTPPSTLINESSLSSLSSSDSWLGSLPISGLEFSEFESFGSYLYDQFNAKSEAWPISEDFVLILPPAPPFSSDNNIIDNISEEVGPTRENEFVQPSYYTPPTPRATPPPFQVATALSPTPSLSSSTPSTFSSSSPPSIVDEDATKSEEEDPEYIPSSCNRPKKRNASALSETPAKRPKILTTPVSCSSTDAARFPCTVPGCKQVCKTLGDLKRHENVLAHKPPSWECRRCRYQFTREDALKRHAKNVPNCASVKVKVRGKAASARSLYPRVGAGEVKTA